MIIAGNFKSNHTRVSTKEYLVRLDTLCEDKGGQDEVLIFPPFTALDKFDLKNISVGIQNGYPAEKGSYTGEICLEAIEEFDINTILIGHSERRHILKEPQEFIARKFEFFKRNNFTIVYCVGEPIEVRQKGIESVMNYIEKQYENIDLEYKNLVIAYEPVWAIGTGRTASPEQAQAVHAVLRTQLAAASEHADRIRLLYGGSMNAANAAQLLAQPDIDGGLIGGAALKAADFLHIIAAAA